MKSVSVALALLAALALAAPAIEAGELHASKGTILSVDVKTGRILMTQERGTHVLALNGQTRVVDETGAVMAAAALQPGDLVREECAADGHGAAVAKHIRLLRPAWMDTASPEM